MNAELVKKLATATRAVIEKHAKVTESKDALEKALAELTETGEELDKLVKSFSQERDGFYPVTLEAPTKEIQTFVRELKEIVQPRRYEQSLENVINELDNSVHVLIENASDASGCQ